MNIKQCEYETRLKEIGDLLGRDNYYDHRLVHEICQRYAQRNIITLQEALLILIQLLITENNYCRTNVMNDLYMAQAKNPQTEIPQVVKDMLKK